MEVVVQVAVMVLVRDSPEARTGILPMQSHREPLAEHDGAGAFGLELAVCQGKGLGKLGPNAPDHLTPASANGFHDHRDKAKPRLLA